MKRLLGVAAVLAVAFGGCASGPGREDAVPTAPSKLAPSKPGATVPGSSDARVATPALCQSPATSFAAAFAQHESYIPMLRRQKAFDPKKLREDRLAWKPVPAGDSATPVDSAFGAGLPGLEVPPAEVELTSAALGRVEPGDPYGCLNTLGSRFKATLATDLSLSFTLGNSPDFCAEAPAVILTSGSTHARFALPELTDWNIDALWCAGNYLVMGIAGQNKTGTERIGVAFMNLATGRTRVIAASAGSGRLSELMEGLRYAKAAQSGDAIAFRLADGTRAAFWPRKQEWSWNSKPVR